MSDSIWILLTACLVAIVCAIPGSILMLRKQSLMGDAISHAVLPGIFLAFMASSSRTPLVLLPGAALSGWLTAQVSAWLIQKKGIGSEAALGLTFTTMFAIGVILISAFARQTDLDVDCVLFGDIVWTPLERLQWNSIDLGPVAFWSLSVGLILFVGFIWLGWRAWQLTTFDPAFAQSLGYSLYAWQSLLLGMVSIACVLSFRSVGSVLVIAFLSVPAATASLYARTLKAQILHACLWACLSALLGWAIALPLDLSISGAMACASAIVFLAVWTARKIFS
jgi:manganese/zinc/iron transport system permease protein